MIKTSYLNISEFLQITKLSKEDLLCMLEKRELEFVKGPEGELLIDISKVTPQTIAQRSTNQDSAIGENSLALIEETIAAEIIANLDGIIDEAIALSLDWYTKKNK